MHWNLLVKKRLAELLKVMDKYGVSHNDVLHLVGNDVNSNKIKTLFKYGFLNQDGWLSFSKMRPLY